MTAERGVKIFENGRNQALRIPREFELPGEDALIGKEGDRPVIEPAASQSLLALLKTLKPIDEDFAPVPDPRPEPVDRWVRDICSTPTFFATSCVLHRARCRKDRSAGRGHSCNEQYCRR